MRGPLLVAQIGLSVAATGILLPPILVAVPALRSPAVGPFVALGLLVLTFVLIRLVWPKARR
jgi:hypothetical protein